MKVGVFLGDVKPIDGGGYRFSDEVLRVLMRLQSRHSFVVFAKAGSKEGGRQGTGRVEYTCSKPNLKDRLKPHWIRKALRRSSNLFFLRKYYRYTDQDWVRENIEDYGVEIMWFATPYFVEIDIPYILTVWDLQHRLQPWFPEVSANGRWHRRESHYMNVLPRASAIMVGTEAGKKEITHFYNVPEERIVVNPQPTPEFALLGLKEPTGKVLKKHGILNGYLFYPAQFWPHKNHIALLRAVKTLKERYGQNFHVVLTGSDKGNLPFIRQAVEELGLSSVVHFLGFVSQEDLLGLYQHAFALVFPTFFGPDNLPPLEAFALGCPVVASNVPGASEQLGDAALLVDPKNEEEIALAIKSLVDDRKLNEELVSRGKVRARHWNGESYVRKVFAFLDEFEAIRRCWSSLGRYTPQK